MNQQRFRAWDQAGKRMIYDGGFMFHQNTFSLLRTAPYCTVFGIYNVDLGFKSYDDGIDIEDPTHVMETIGCQDSEGNSLYIGDIIQDVTGENYRIVEQSPNGCLVKSVVKNDGLHHRPGVSALKLATRVGNVFENPELIHSN